MDESTIHAGGHPIGGLGLTSANYRMSLDTVGEAVTAPLLSNSTNSMDVGFSRSYPPPAEVRQVVALGDKATFAWAPERSVGTYRVYRGYSTMPPAHYGFCRIGDVAGGSVLLEEAPDSGQQFFYLVTAQNMLFEEGITGYDSAGTPRGNPGPCP